LDTQGITRSLVALCRGRWWLRGLLGPLYRHAERRGYKTLVRENASRLLEEAQVARLQGREDAGDLAGAALDRWEALAAAGDAEGAWRLAEAHRTGFGRARHHWKAVEHYRLALDLGHPRAQGRLKALEAGEPVDAAEEEAEARRALLRSTYGEGEGARRLRRAGEAARDMRREGIGFRASAVILAAAGLLLGYLVLDVYFFGLGAWRPDPTRVVWGIVGKVHPPKGSGLGRVIPGWLRPDARSVTFTVSDFVGETSGRHTLADFRGRVVYLHVVDGDHPMVREAGPALREMYRRRDPAFAGFVLLVPSGRPLEDLSSWNQGFQWAMEFAPAIAEGRKGARPLGSMTVFPMNYVIDRQGRIRQAWAGWSAELTEKAVREALAE